MTPKLFNRKIDPFTENPIEAIRDITSSTVDSLENDLGKEAISEAWAQLLGKEKKPAKAEGELKEGQEIFLSKTIKRGVEAGIDYTREILQKDTQIRKQEGYEVKAKAEEILVELKRLSETTQELKVEFKELTMEELPENPGKYHLNFLEWVFAVVRAARIKMENSAGWMQALMSKKNKKDYWAMTKKHGTSFSLSGERVSATQTG